jgi:Ca2+-binding EF-hand superfamily protein
MLSPFRRQKITHFFTLFDADGDGYIEQRDLRRWADEIARVGGAGRGTPEYEELHALWAFTWAALEKDGSSGRDDVVGPTQWLELCEAILSTEEGYTMVMNAIGARSFDVIDADGDGELRLEEWRAFYRAIGVDEAAATGTFVRFDADRDGRITRSETMSRLWEFFCSDDEAAPGNWFFGPLEAG